MIIFHLEQYLSTLGYLKLLWKLLMLIARTCIAVCFVFGALKWKKINIEIAFYIFGPSVPSIFGLSKSLGEDWLKLVSLAFCFV